MFWAGKHFVRDSTYESDRKSGAELVKKDLDGIGGRISNVELDIKGNATTLQGLIRRTDIAEGKINDVYRDLGKIETSLEKLESITQQTKFDIIAAFQDRTNQITEHLSQLENFVGRLDERVKMVKEILAGKTDA